MLFVLLRFLLLCSLSMPILAIRNFTFSKVNDRSQLPHRMRQMVRVEWDGSTTVQYGRTSPQSLNLYFALPAAPRPPGAVPLPSPVTFTVTIDSLDACTCVTQSVYDNILAFAWNRRFADRILPEEVVYLTWNLWQSGNSSADNDGRSVYFSATDFNGFGNADGPSSWTILSGGQRRARVTVPIGNGSLMLEYGSRLALLYTVPHGKVRRHLSFRLISQRELLQLHPWLGSQLSAGRTPRCDWALNFSSKYRLLFPTNGTLAVDKRRRRNERIDDGQRGNEADNNGIEHCSRK
ncbi:hypothetical protein niasHT_021739 [Heterodera trifolii]|uniref:Uncharacterized protein n=1 Tax=Heterodera trifolii TaxID=157864 RepID=A0ABD2KRX5_9BILA